MTNLRHDPHFAKLRRQATQRLDRLIKQPCSTLDPDQMEDLLHELQVHQIELEIQNDELARAQTELEESRDAFRELYESLPVGYVTLDREGRMSNVNSTAMALLKWDAQRHPIQYFNAFVSDQAVDRFILWCRRVVAMQSDDTVELELKRFDGSVFPGAMQASPVRTGKGKGKLLRMTFSDMTRRNQAEEASSRLEIQLNANRAELHTLTRKLLTVQKGERERIARELHDDYCQRVTVLILDANILQKTFERNAPSLVPSLTAIRQKLSAMLNDFRTFSHDLLHSNVGDTAPAVAVRQLVNEFGASAGFEIKFVEQAIPDHLEVETMTTIYRLLQESLCNIVKHANAKHVTVTLAGTGHQGVTLVVVDDGIGFDPTHAGESQQGVGLVGMQERLRSIGGVLKILSQPGQGTSVICSIPGTRSTD